MKDILKITGIFALLLAVIPLFALFSEKDAVTGAAGTGGSAFAAKLSAAETVFSENAYTETEQTSADMSAVSETAAETDAPEKDDEDIIKVLDYTCGQVLELSMRDYVIGAVLAEMPATYNIEALKAQAVAARTYAYRQREKQRLSPDPLLMGADISNDSSRYQAYFTPARAKEFYGSGYEIYSEKAAEAVDLTDRMILVYEGEPIVAAFHSMSSGRTESAETVWGSAVDYLVPVDSSGDEDAPSYIEEKILSENECREILENSVNGAELSSDPENWIVISQRSASGAVTEMTAGGAEISGGEFRSIFSLRSANFTVSYKDGEFTFTTKGYGHGVGMSQFGANTMAENGKNFKEILYHYYTGAELEEY